MSDTKLQRAYQRKLKYSLPIALIIIVAGSFLIDGPGDRRPDLKVKSQSYVYTGGCPNAKYGKGYIPNACARSQYIVQNPERFGLEPKEHWGRRWYRIGDDAFFIGCDTTPCVNNGQSFGKFIR